MIDNEVDRSAVAAWRDLLGRHAAVWCALERELGERHALGVSEFEVLERIVEDGTPGLVEDGAPGLVEDGTPGLDGSAGVRVQELAGEVYLSQSALSRVIGRLERDGLVSRAICQADRRGIYVCLTPLGRERYAAARATQRKVLATTLAR